MRIVLEPSGTHVHKEKLKIRLDFYPDEADKSYFPHYIYSPVIPADGFPGEVDENKKPVSRKDYDDWIAALPRIWQINPSLCAFVEVHQDITKKLLLEWCNDILKADEIATIDDIMAKQEPGHFISPFMRNKRILYSQKVKTFDALIKNDINNRLSDFNIGGLPGGKKINIEPRSIDIGPGATNRATYDTNNITISPTNPANESGILSTVEIWMASNCTADGLIGTAFVVSGNNLTSRDYENVGAITAGSKQTFTSLSIDVTAGDYIFCDRPTGNIEKDTTGATGIWYASASATPFTNKGFSKSTDGDVSLYGTGEPSALIKILSESIGVTESQTKRAYSIELISESIGITESFIKSSFTSLVKLMNETLSVIDTGLRRMVMVRVFSETLSVLDSGIAKPLKNILIYMKTRSKTISLSIHNKVINLKARSKNIDLQVK